MAEILRHCPSDCLDDGTCHRGQPLPPNKNICYRPPQNGIVKTDDPTTCPRCGSNDVGQCGGDMDGSGGYYFMYLCESCGRKKGGAIQVFLVPCSKEEYDAEFKDDGSGSMGIMMPIPEKWGCENCGHEFNKPKWMISPEEAETPLCPECGSMNIDLQNQESRPSQ